MPRKFRRERVKSWRVEALAYRDERFAIRYVSLGRCTVRYEAILLATRGCVLGLGGDAIVDALAGAALSAVLERVLLAGEFCTSRAMQLDRFQAATRGYLVAEARLLGRDTDGGSLGATVVLDGRVILIAKSKFTVGRSIER